MTESRPKVLSIDDNLSLNSMRQMVLSVSGFDCDLAGTAEQEVLLARLRAVVTSKSMIAQAMHAAAS